jgi:hypothetical protein
VSPEIFWRELCRSVGCVVCNRFAGGAGPIEMHHVAEGSGLRHPHAQVPLCHEHHEGGAGLHGMGPKRFIMLYRPPGDSEYGLLVWLNEDLALLLRRGLQAKKSPGG